MNSYTSEVNLRVKLILEHIFGKYIADYVMYRSHAWLSNSFDVQLGPGAIYLFIYFY